MKFSVRPQFHRLQGMIELLRRGAQTGSYPNCTDFTRAFHASRPTALRDLDFLRDEWGAPIEYDASRKGYYLSDPTWTVPDVTVLAPDTLRDRVRDKMRQALEREGNAKRHPGTHSAKCCCRDGRA